MMASTVVDNVSMALAPLAAKSSTKRRCLRARARMIASAYIYRPLLAQGHLRSPKFLVSMPHRKVFFDGCDGRLRHMGEQQNTIRLSLDVFNQISNSIDSLPETI